MLDQARRFEAACVTIRIAAVDKATPALLKMAQAMSSLRQWREVRRIIQGELEPFGFREIPSL